MGKLVKVFRNGIEVDVISAEVNREGERVIDAGKFVFTGDKILNYNDKVEYLQHFIDITSLEAFYGFEDHLKDESTKTNNGYLRDTGLVSWHPFENNVRDFVSNNDGTVTGLEQYTSGQILRAFDFDGSTSIALGDTPYDFDFDDPFTIAFWIKFANPVSIAEAIIVKGNNVNPSGDAGIKIFTTTAGTLRFRGSNGTTSEIDLLSISQVDDGNWHHVVCTYDGSVDNSGAKMYVDGALDVTGGAAVTTGSMLNNLALTIGAETDGGRPLTAQMDNVLIWSRELSATEVTYLFRSRTNEQIMRPFIDGKVNKSLDLLGSTYVELNQKALIAPSLDVDSDLVAHWRFDENLRDSKGVNDLAKAAGTEKYVNGIFGRAFDFNGSTYHTVPTESTFDFEHSDAFSVSFWIKTPAVVAAKGLIVKSTDLTTAVGLKVQHDSTGLIIFTLADGTTAFSITSVTEIDNNAWHYVTCTYDGSSNRSGMKIYIDNVLDATGTASVITSTILNNQLLALGAESDGGNQYTGQLDDVRFYKKELTQANVTTLAKQLGDFERTDSFSLSGWFKSPANASAQVLISKQNVSPSIGWRVQLKGTGGIRAFIENSSSNRIIVESTTTGLDDNADHHVIVTYDGSGLASGVKIYLNGVLETNVVVQDDLASNTILNNESVVLGARADGSLPLIGKLDNVEIYARVLTQIEATRLGTKDNPISIMKFAGRIWKIEKEMFVKKVEVKSLGKELGEFEVRGDVFNNQSPESIMQSIIAQSTTLQYIDSGQASGIELIKYVADGKMIDIVTDLSRLTNRLWRTDALGNFFFEPFKFRISNVVYTHGTNVGIFETGEDDTELVNDLIILGENKRYISLQSFSGDGTKTEFDLAEPAISARVTLSGIEQNPEIDFTLDTENKKLKFTVAPPSGTDNIVIDYEYEKPLFIRQIRQSSIDKFGRRAKRLIMPWIREYQDGVRFASSYLHVFQDVKTKADVTVLGLEHRLKENDVVTLVNSIKEINTTFLVKGIVWKYPQATTTIKAGEFSFDEQESKKQILEKIHDLESSLTVVKEIREYESAEELLNLTDAVLVEPELSFLEALALIDAPVTVTERFKAVYSVSTTNYSQDDVYSDGASP